MTTRATGFEEPKALRAVAYLRVSTEEQHLGPEAQRDAINRWAAANDAEIAAWYEDIGLSGGLDLDQRPGLLAALDGLKQYQASALVVAKRDRLARDVLVAAMVQRLVQRSRAKVVSADGSGNGDGPEAMLMAHIINAFAEYERALIRARTKAALKVKGTRYERVGRHDPFGWKLGSDGRTYVPDELERRTVDAMKTLRDEGRSFRWIAAYLNAHPDKFPLRREATHYTRTTVFDMLARQAKGFENWPLRCS